MTEECDNPTCNGNHEWIEENREKIKKLSDELFLILKFEDDFRICDSTLMSTWMTLIVHNLEKDNALSLVKRSFKEVRRNIMKHYEENQDDR